MGCPQSRGNLLKSLNTVQPKMGNGNNKKEHVVRIATLNVQWLTNPKVISIVRWMKKKGVVALAIQEHKLVVDNLLPLPISYKAILGPLEGTNNKRGCGWIVHNGWATRNNLNITHESPQRVSIQIMNGAEKIMLHSIYSGPGEALTSDEHLLGSQCKKLNETHLWMGDINADPNKKGKKSLNGKAY